MSKPWTAVAASPEFQALSADDQEAARQQYFSQVVAPKVPPDQVDAARSQFDSATGRSTQGLAGTSSVSDLLDTYGQKAAPPAPPGPIARAASAIANAVAPLGTTTAPESPALDLSPDTAPAAAPRAAPAAPPLMQQAGQAIKDAASKVANVIAPPGQTTTLETPALDLTPDTGPPAAKPAPAPTPAEDKTAFIHDLRPAGAPANVVGATWDQLTAQQKKAYMSPALPTEARPVRDQDLRYQPWEDQTPENPVEAAYHSALGNAAHSFAGELKMAADASGSRWLNDRASYYRAASAKILDRAMAGNEDSTTTKTLAGVFGLFPLVAGAPAGITSMVAQSGGDGYQQARDGGDSPSEAVGRGAALALANYVGLQTRVPGIANGLAKAVQGAPAGEALGALAHAISTNVGGMGATTAITDLYDKFMPGGLRQDMTVADMVHDLADTAKDATLISLAVPGAPLAGRQLVDAAYRVRHGAGNVEVARAIDAVDLQRPGIAPAGALDINTVHASIDDAAAKVGLTPKAAAALRDKVASLDPQQAIAFVARAFHRFESNGLTKRAGAPTAFQDALQERAAPPASPGANPDASPGADTGPVDASDVLGTPSEDVGDVNAIAHAAHEAATSPLNERPEPTPAQKEAGNYPMGHVRVHGLDISIENPQGSTRSGTSPDGATWSNTLAGHYGYIRGTEASDGDHVDTFLGPNPASLTAYVIDQVDPHTGKFDEPKTVLGADSVEQAREIYNGSFDGDWNGLGAITALPMDEFKTWVRDGVKSKPLGDLSQWRPRGERAQSDVANSSPAAAAATGGRSDLAGRGRGDQRPDAAVAPVGGERADAAAPDAGTGKAAPVAGAGESDASLRLLGKPLGDHTDAGLRKIAGMKSVSATARKTAADELARRAKSEGVKPPAPTAPESAAEQPQGANHGQGKEQGQGRQEGLLKPPAQPRAGPSGAAKHPATVMGSRVLALVSKNLGGLDPAWLSEFSHRIETKKLDKHGKPRIFWRNPLIQGIGTLFRRGGTQDLEDMARMFQEHGYLEPGTVERDPHAAGQQAQEIVRAALNRTETSTVDEQQTEHEASQQHEADAYYAELDAQSAREAEAERQTMLGAHNIEPSVFDRLMTDDEIATGAPELSDRQALADYLGVTPEDLDNERRSQEAASLPGEDRPDGQAGRDAGEGSRAADEAGAPAPRDRREATDQGLSLTAHTADELKAKATREAAAKAADDAEQRRLENKTKADAERGDFALTGSDRPADVAAAAGQRGMFDEPAPEPAKMPEAPPSRPTASWVIKDKATGKVQFETFDRKKVDALNTKKYVAVPIQEHLASLNGPVVHTEGREYRVGDDVAVKYPAAKGYPEGYVKTGTITAIDGERVTFKPNGGKEMVIGPDRLSTNLSGLLDRGERREQQAKMEAAAPHFGPPDAEEMAAEEKASGGDPAVWSGRVAFKEGKPRKAFPEMGADSASRFLKGWDAAQAEQQKGDIPPAVASRVKAALDNLGEINRELAEVKRSGGAVELANRLRDRAAGIQKAQDTLAKVRDLAKGNGADVGGLIRDLGGEPDFSAFGAPSATAAPAVTPNKSSTENVASLGDMASAATPREMNLREIAHADERPGDVMLGNDKFVTLDEAKAAARAAIDDGSLRNVPFQYANILDIAPRDWTRMVDEMKPYAEAAKPSAPGVHSVHEPDAPYTADLFGDPLPPEQRSDRPARPERAGLRGDVQPASAVLGDTPAPAGDYLTRTIVGSEVRRTLGAERVQSAADAAAATHYLYKSAVERFDGVVTDAAGKPLATIGGFKGALSEASVYPSTLIGEAVRIPGAARVWFSHNHPSGTSELSAADQRMNLMLSDVFRGSGIEPMGLLAIGDGKYSAVDAKGVVLHRGEPIPAASGSVAVPAIERQVSERHAAAAVTSPAQAKEVSATLYQHAGDKPGMVLLNNQHGVVGWVPLSGAMMDRLRGTGGLNALMRAVSEANAKAAIIVHGGELDARLGRHTIAQNIGGALAGADVRLLDIINAKTGASAAERGEAMTASPILSQVRAPFYSALERGLTGVNVRQGDAGTWRQVLKGLQNKGVKPEEIAWSGLDDWLNMQPGKVSKEQVLDYLHGNGVQVHETMRTEAASLSNVETRANRVLEGTGFRAEADPHGDDMLIVDKDDELVEFDDLPQDLQRRLQDEAQRADASPTKFGQYVLPGGKNYHELLLTLPETPASRRLHDLEVKVNSGARMPVEDREQYHDLVDRRAGAPTFRSNHWDEPNVLAHVRFNDRTDADGKRVLFIEEIQSDWAQQGKKQGFAGQPASPDERRAVAEKVRQADDTLEAIKSLFAMRQSAVEDAKAKVTRLQRDPRSQLELAEAREFLRQQGEKEDAARARLSPASDALTAAMSEQNALAERGNGVPRGPFVGKTDAWVSLALKRMAKYAVDHGYDRVAFVNGEQSAERYDLSKQIDSIETSGRIDAATGESSGKAIVLNLPNFGGSLEFSVGLDGKVANVRRDMGQGIKVGTPLEDIIGKELAERVMEPQSQGTRNFEGEGLKVGGEGMKAFYDKIVPSVAKEVVRKLGGDGLTTVSLQGPRFTAAEMDRHVEAHGYPPEEGVRHDQPGFDITDKMRAAAGEGVPLFRRGAEPATGVHPDVLRTEAERIQSTWKDAPPVHVVADVSELPAHIQRALRSMGAEGKTRALLMPEEGGKGDVYLVANMLPDLATAQFAVFHEVLGHYGLRSVLGSEDAYYRAMYGLRQANPALATEAEAWWQQHGQGAVADRVRRGMTIPDALKEVRALSTEEALADRAGRGEPIRGWQKIMAKVQAWLRSVGLHGAADRLEAMTEAETAGLLARARQAVEDGQPSVFTDEGGRSPLLSSTDETDETVLYDGPGGRSVLRTGRAVDRIGRLRPSSGLLDTTLRHTVGQASRLTSPLYDRMIDLLDRGAHAVGGDVYLTAKAGLVADYGLTPEYKRARADMQTAIRKGVREAASVIDQLKTLDRSQSRVAYQWMQAKPSEAVERRLMAQLPDDSRQALTMLKDRIDQLGKMAVELGLMTQETYERNSMSYLHRSYLKYELGEDAAAAGAARARATRILGDQFKGRGMRDDAAEAAIATPEWWQRRQREGQADTSLKGKTFLRLELRGLPDQGTEDMLGGREPQLGKLRKVLYWPAEEPIPRHLADWRNDGTWEARFFDKGGKVGMWRDFTPDERTAMGEIQEVRYSAAKTILQASRDVEVARMLDWVARNVSELTADRIPATAELVDASPSLTRAFRSNEWVQVPDTSIPGTGLKRWGNLAGRHIPGPVWNDLRQVNSLSDRGDLARAWGHLLSAWKVSKTALSPTTHVNNVMSNFVLADAHDIQARHVIGSLRTWLGARKKDPTALALLHTYQDHGGDGGKFNEGELREDLAAQLIDQLEADVNHQDGATALASAASVVDLLSHREFRQAFAALGQTRVAQASKGVLDKLVRLYGREDELFRLAAFIKAKADGLSDHDAGQFARASFLDYNINAPWIAAARRTAFPFIAFTYRAAPMLARIAAERPDKIAKYMLVAGTLNALAYQMLGSDHDEKRERALLPDEKAGNVWGVFPKLLRMPWDSEIRDRDGNTTGQAPVFLDVRRWIPAGDIVDTDGQSSALPIPSPLMPGGPLMLMAETLLNKQGFTGQPITLATDTMGEKFSKYGDYLWKGLMPNNPLVPGSYSYDHLRDAGTGKLDPLMRQYNLTEAALSALGVKVAGYDRTELARQLQLDTMAKIGEIRKVVHQAAIQYARQGMTAEDFGKVQASAQVKIQAIQESLSRKTGVELQTQ